MAPALGPDRLAGARGHRAVAGARCGGCGPAADAARPRRTSASTAPSACSSTPPTLRPGRRSRGRAGLRPGLSPARSAAAQPPDRAWTTAGRCSRLTPNHRGRSPRRRHPATTGAVGRPTCSTDYAAAIGAPAAGPDRGRAAWLRSTLPDTGGERPNLDGHATPGVERWPAGADLLRFVVPRTAAERRVGTAPQLRRGFGPAVNEQRSVVLGVEAGDAWLLRRPASDG
jgi:hypothetical protein